MYPIPIALIKRLVNGELTLPETAHLVCCLKKTGAIAYFDKAVREKLQPYAREDLYKKAKL